ncbi:hypothetical protein BCR34DRAFT_588778 [Clohesyomyces aquaticus]|uniref:Uncharacterized protein n=1 Tax=Clohesyomyces aquaticus TaxID=1231657 RepID=A0A1Y1ZIU9_9PLEO|nr:hypothetical protein BCR34DRAFT_588778 [Clohesyomyces aquaticus]
MDVAYSVNIPSTESSTDAAVRLGGLIPLPGGGYLLAIPQSVSDVNWNGNTTAQSPTLQSVINAINQALGSQVSGQVALSAASIGTHSVGGVYVYTGTIYSTVIPGKMMDFRSDSTTGFLGGGSGVSPRPLSTSTRSGGGRSVGEKDKRRKLFVVVGVFVAVVAQMNWL